MLYFKAISNKIYEVNDRISIRGQLNAFGVDGVFFDSVYEGSIKCGSDMNIQDCKLLELLELTCSIQENNDEQWEALEQYMEFFYDMDAEDYLDECGYMDIDKYLHDAAKLDPRIDWLWIG